MKKYTEHTTKSLIQAYNIQEKLITELHQAHEELSHIHSNLDNTQGMDELWKIRARVQDALRSIIDLQPLRKDLPMVK